MTYLDQLPPERDLPAARQARMRHRILDSLFSPGRPAAVRGRALRLLGASLATAACATAVVVWTGGPSAERQQPEVVALGDSALSPIVRDTGNLCLTHARQEAADPMRNPDLVWPADGRPTMVNYAERESRAIVIYRLAQWLIFCTMEPTNPPSGEWSSSSNFARAPQWLAGPLEGSSASSSDPWGGTTAVAGFVHRRVAKVVLDDGAGHRSTARLADGTFAVLSDGDLAARKGRLISYDEQGREIDRRDAFDLGVVGTTCWVDPAGKVVLYGMDRKHAPTPPPVGCGKAEPWTPPKGWTPA
ncbi:hypothetical protein [Catellatospora sichuanensis]|uniref:hypothetical protein n=1 Tax=Catellatospora sichuanensis TaxID=1969805 RepID=UPI00118322F3|nr:hypothetical protein [Catellatospora sichuanensis]